MRAIFFSALVFAACAGTDCPRDRGAGESCCVELGIDACGGNLFCAAFDGRSQAVCYGVRSRLDLTECSADDNCLSGRCSASAHVCESLPGMPCRADVGCVSSPDGKTRFACDGATCQPAGPPCDPNAPALSLCGHECDTGNSMGVGKYCKSASECAHTAAYFCSAADNGTSPSMYDSYFCTMQCNAADPNACGENATCTCSISPAPTGTSCACIPSACKQ